MRISAHQHAQTPPKLPSPRISIPKMAHLSAQAAELKIGFREICHLRMMS
jgi:hypothetical protein